MILHHVGYVVKDVDMFARGFPGLTHEKTIEDPVQMAKISMYQLPNARLEFIQPLTPDAFTYGFLEKNGEGLHHICYDGVGSDQIDAVLRQSRMLKLRGPIHAVLFDRPVVFAMTRQRSIVEFLL